MNRPPPSPSTSEALQVLGAAIRIGRIRRRWSVAELAERVGVSHPTITKVERGDPTVAIGTALEAATLVGMPLLDPDPDHLRRHHAHLRIELALLPSTARQRRVVDDDF